MSRLRYGLAIAALALTVLVLEVFVGHAVPLRAPLQEAPFTVATWRGRVEPADSEFLQRARPDEILSRRYTDRAGQPILVYVGYYASQASQGQVQAVCHGDCDVLSRGTRVLHLQGGPVVVNRAVVRQNRMLTAVLYWYQEGADVTYDAYRNKVRQVRRVVLHRRSDGAVVKLSTPVVTTEDEAWQRIAAFAKALYPILRQHFPD